MHSRVDASVGRIGKSFKFDPSHAKTQGFQFCAQRRGRGRRTTLRTPKARFQHNPSLTAQKMHPYAFKSRGRAPATLAAKNKSTHCGEPSKAPAHHRHTRAPPAPTPSTTTLSDAASPTKQKPRPAARSSSRTLGSRDKRRRPLQNASRRWRAGGVEVLPSRRRAPNSGTRAARVEARAARGERDREERPDRLRARRRAQARPARAPVRRRRLQVTRPGASSSASKTRRVDGVGGVDVPSRTRAPDEVGASMAPTLQQPELMGGARRDGALRSLPLA